MDLSEPGTYTDLINKLNTITTNIMTIARARKTRAENGQEAQPGED